MSLKDRLNLRQEISVSEQEIDASVEEKIISDKKEDFYINQFKDFLERDINILVCCPIDIPTYNAINFLCSKIPNDKRLVGIGSNLLLNPDEIIKFEPENKTQPKQLIKTAMSLNPFKIVLQNFDGAEAVDIFKLTNAGIKNIICAVSAENAQKSLLQAELNLYMNGASVPELVMKQMLSELFDKIIVIKSDPAANGNCAISKIFDIDSFQNGEYIITEILDNKDITTPLKTETPTETKPENEIETKPENSVEPKPENAIEAKPENPIEPKPENEIEKKPENPIEQKTENEIEAKPENPIETKPENPIEPKPENEIETKTKTSDIKKKFNDKPKNKLSKLKRKKNNIKK